jgi:KDO2-lipid IV(A) lauroyltransferase
MQAIGFYLTLPFIYLISILPFPVLYLFSDFVFVLMYYVTGYRRKVVAENLRKSFPEKSHQEILELERKFYRYLSDLILEIVKTLTLRKSAMRVRCRMDEKTVELMRKFQEEKKSCILVLGHLGNWEWASNTFSLACKQPLYGIYHPLKNKYYNTLSTQMRTRFGTQLIAMKNTFRDMLALKNQITATAFIADQTPPPESAYWTNFLNQDTPVFQGTEKIARKLNYPVVFMSVNRLKRGYYEISSELLCENPSATSEGEISEMHTKKLEKEIRKNPQFWLWSHRRWKHKRTV